MNNRSLLLDVVLMLSLVIVTACQVEVSSNEGATQADPPTSINLVSLANLRETTQIDLVRREDRNETTSARLELLFVFTDEQAIESLVNSLDKDLALIPHASSSSNHTLVFHLADGRTNEFDYASEMASSSYLRTGQKFGLGQDVIVPDSFNRLMSIHIAEAAIREKAIEK